MHEKASDSGGFFYAYFLINFYQKISKSITDILKSIIFVIKKDETIWNGKRDVDICKWNSLKTWDYNEIC